MTSGKPQSRSTLFFVIIWFDWVIEITGWLGEIILSFIQQILEISNEDPAALV